MSTKEKGHYLDLLNAIAYAILQYGGKDMHFSALVKFVRKELNISQEQLAHKLNISFLTVNQWETGKLLLCR